MEFLNVVGLIEIYLTVWPLGHLLKTKVRCDTSSQVCGRRRYSNSCASLWFCGLFDLVTRQRYCKIVSNGHLLKTSSHGAGVGFTLIGVVQYAAFCLGWVGLLMLIHATPTKQLSLDQRFNNKKVCMTIEDCKLRRKFRV